MERTPSQLARTVGMVVIGGIVVALVLFLAITWWQGDPTNNRQDNQPEPSPSSAHVVG